MRYWIVSWDHLGVEFFQEITEHHPDNWAKQHLFDSIKGSKVVSKPLGFNLNALLLRAKMNSQRHYEIYVFTSNEDINETDITEWFERDPQEFADWVRANHSYCLFNDKARDDRRVIV